MTTGEKLKKLRLEHQLTLEQVGDAVGVGKSTVRKWENGIIANMKRDKIASLAKVLHTTPAYIMGWTDNPTSEEKPAAESGSELSPKARRAMELIQGLDDDDLDMVLEIVRSILARRGK